VKELAAMLKVGRNTAYELVRCGAVKSVKIGRQIRVPKSAVLEYIDRRAKDKGF
jgi:excisionase family DNA binding protein